MKCPGILWCVWVEAVVVIAVLPAMAAPSVPSAVIVPAGAQVPRPLVIDEGGLVELELVAGRVSLPEIGSLRLSLWALGGPMLAPLMREQPFDGERKTDADGVVRIRFHLPALEARPGAMLRLAVSVAEGKGILAEAWLQVGEPFNPAGLREWAERHPVSVDPALTGVIAAMRQWGIPVREDADPAIAIVGSPESAPPGATAVLILRQAKDGRSRMVVRVISDETRRVEASLPSLTAIDTDPSSRREFLDALREVATLLGAETDFPNP